MRGKGRLLLVLVNVCRLLLAATFLFSGFVKANDPIGMSMKIEEYARALGVGGLSGLLFLFASIVLAFVESSLGICLLMGLNRRFVAHCTLVLMVAMTALTVWTAAADPVSDCGCFGDALTLTNGQSLAKNAVLLAAAWTVFRWSRLQKRFISESSAWLVSLPCMAGSVAFAAYCVYALPVVDFRPYKVGTDLRTAWEEAQTATRQYEVKIVYERDGRKMELDADADDPDSTWTYVETRREPVGQGQGRRDLLGFYVENESEEDVTADILYDEGYTFLLVAPDLRLSDQGCAGEVNELYDYAVEQGYGFYCLTASDKTERDRWTDYTGAEYGFCLGDERVLKTMVRANPGLLLLKDGRIVGKWSNWRMPSFDRPLS